MQEEYSEYGNHIIIHMMHVVLYMLHVVLPLSVRNLNVGSRGG